MKHFDLIKKAVLTEKAHKLMVQNAYSFIVSKKATKKEIKELIQKQFGVDVERVNVLGFAPKRKRVSQTRKTTLVGGGKKAVVHLKEGQTITLLSPEKGKKSKDKKEDKKEEKKTEKKETETTKKDI